MSIRAKFILFFGLGGVIFLFVITLLVFNRMELAMQVQLEKQFRSDVHSRIAGLNAVFSGQKERFQSSARLPMFRSMRFHQLTLNQPALKNDVRQMELHLLDLMNKNVEISQVRYINNKGYEVLRVDKSGINKNLSDLSQDKMVNEMLGLGFGDLRLTRKIVDNRIRDIVWWVPVYISSNVKYGVIGFSINYQHILGRVGKMVASEAEGVCLRDALGVVLLGGDSETTCSERGNNIWYATDKIGLPGLNWTISLSVNQDSFLTDIYAIKKTVFGIIFPVVAFFAFILAFIFSSSISHTIKKLVDAAGIIGRGEKLVPINVSRSDELGELAKEMNRSARMLEDSRNGLIEAKKRDLKTIMDNSPAVIFIKDINGRYTFINHQYEKLFHVCCDDFMGKTDYDIFPEEYADLFQAHDQSVLDAGHALESEEMVPQDDGIHIYVSSKFPLFDEVGKAYAVCGISTDVTERKQIEEDRQRAERILRSQARIIDQIHDSVISTDLDGLITSWNKGSERLFGYTDKEILGKHVASVYPESEHTRLENKIIPDLVQKGAYDIEVQLLHKSGDVFFAHVSLSMIYDDEGNAVGMIGYTININERKLAEISLKNSEFLLEKAQEIAKIGYWKLKPETGEVTGSDELFRIFGFSREEASLDAFVKVVHPDDRAMDVAAIRRVIEIGESWDIEHRLICRDGIEKWVHAIGEATTDRAGKVVEVLGTVQDITKQKRVEVELVNHHEQLEKLVEKRTRELRDTQDELVYKERLSTLGQLTATVSHELRNPLAAMRPSLYAIRIMSSADDKRMQLAIERVERGISRCDHIIDELLDFTRITDMEFETVVLDDWLREILSEQTIHPDILFTQTLSLGGYQAEIDVNRLRRAVINVIDNACQALQEENDPDRTCSGAELTIETVKEGDRIEIRIQDTGSGIPENALSKIFEPLYSTKSFGVGLGMPIIKQIMEQHGGGIEVVSEQGKGTLVTLWIPSAL